MQGLLQIGHTTPGRVGLRSAVPTTLDQRRFALRYLAIAGVLFAIYCFPYGESGVSERWFSAYLGAYAHVVGKLIAIFEPGVVVSANQISGSFSIAIVKSCDAMEANILFVAAVLAFPARWGRKVAAAFAGLALLILANVIRLLSLYYVGKLIPTAFDVFHVEVWPLLMIVFAVVDFLAWVSWMKRPLPGVGSTGGQLPA